MKILFLTNKVPYPPKDGGSVATLGMIKAFADAGHQTTVLAMNTKKHHITPFELPQELSARIIFHLVEVPALITPFGIIKNFLFSKLPYNAERFINDNYQHQLELLLSKHSYDIIQLEGLYLLPYISTIRGLSSAKIAYRSHNIEHEIWQRTAKQSSLIKRIYLQNLSRRIRTMELETLNNYDILVPITKRDEQKYLQLGNKKPSIAIPAGFDIEENYSEKTLPKNNLFFLGALDWTPNQEGLVWFFDYCWPIIKKKRPETELVIAGRNAPDWFKEKLTSYDITFLGEIESAREYMLQNGVMIAPVLSGGGMRVKIIEGMLYRKPVVTTSIGCEGINVQNKKQLYIANTPDVFASYSLLLLNNFEKAKQTGDLAFQFATKYFNNRQLNKQLVTFYNQQLK